MLAKIIRIKENQARMLYKVEFTSVNFEWRMQVHIMKYSERKSIYMIGIQ